MPPRKSDVPKCVMCAIAYWELKRDALSNEIKMSRSFYNKFIGDLEKKLTTVVELRSLNPCEKHYAEVRQKRMDECRTSSEKLAELARKLDRTGLEYKKVQEKYMLDSIYHELPTETRARLWNTMQHLDRVFAQRRRRYIEAKAKALPIQNTKTKQVMPSITRTVINSRGVSYSPKEEFIMPDLGADCFSSGDKTGGKD